jgi:hypothetical protein
MNQVTDLLVSKGSSWHSHKGADDIELSTLKCTVQVRLPDDYLDLLRACNGSEGELALAPLWLQLHNAKEVVELTQSKFHN